jgi:hypothetical protein
MLMTAIDNTPENKNFLSPLNFKFHIKKSPHVNFFTQKVNIPSIRIPEKNISNPFVTIPYSGDHINYEPLEVTFKVDENLQNYLEIHNWLKSLGKPQNFDQYAELAKIPSYTGDGIISDISVVVLSSSKLANYEVTYVDCFPISLSGLVFNTTPGDVNYMEATVLFKYNYYNIDKIV